MPKQIRDSKTLRLRKVSKRFQKVKTSVQSLNVTCEARCRWVCFSRRNTRDSGCGCGCNLDEKHGSLATKSLWHFGIATISKAFIATEQTCQVLTAGTADPASSPRWLLKVPQCTNPRNGGFLRGHQVIAVTTIVPEGPVEPLSLVVE